MIEEKVRLIPNFFVSKSMGFRNVMEIINPITKGIKSGKTYLTPAYTMINKINANTQWIIKAFCFYKLMNYNTFLMVACKYGTYNYQIPWLYYNVYTGGVKHYG